jgi:membrane-associated protein
LSLNIGYWAGRLGGATIVDRLAKPPARGIVVENARGVIRTKSAIAVFLTRWLFSPLGPYVNLLSGATRHKWAKFTLWGIAGEVVWCGLYVLMGRNFVGNLEAASTMVSSILGLVAASTAMVGLGWWLIAIAQKDRVYTR